MNRISGFFLSLYNFFAGDPVILSGTLAIFVIVGIITHTLAGVNVSLPIVLLIAGVISSLALSLYREIRPKARP